jgi:RHS repeat-associated protein
MYDKTSQLIDAIYNYMQRERYRFDLNGNRQTAEIHGQNQTYKTGKYNRLLSDANYRYEYDREGNRIAKTSIKDGKTTKYTWDNRNRLIKITTPTSEIEYLYDYQNRLVKRTENKTTQQYFIHDNWQIVLQFDNKNLQPTHRYLWGTKQDELLCDNNNWTLGDHLNTIRDIINSDGKVADHLEYNSFGKLISVTKNPNTTFFDYTGKLTDKSSDLQWNINRWYDSDVGRWVSEDPLSYFSGEFNLYNYVRNNPYMLVDQLGLADKKIAYVGTFDIDIIIADITDARQEKHLGNAVTAYKISYHATKGSCTGANQKISLTQSVAVSSIWGNPISFDCDTDNSNKGLPYPQYNGPGDGKTHIIDSPLDTRKMSTRDTTFRLTVCAICTTTNATKECPNVKPSAEVLGCINFRWYDVAKKVKYNGNEYKLNDSKHGIPAMVPEKDWDKAKSAWDKSAWGTK